MKLLKEISEKSLGFGNREILAENYILRKSARAVLLNERGEISLQFVGKHNFYKLPGGGVEIGESPEEALKREILEEVGCDIEIDKPLGVTIEYRNSQNIIHISYCFLCKIKGKMNKPEYTEEEIRDGYESVWKALDESLDLMKKFNPKEPYQAKFIVERETAFLNEYKDNLKLKNS